MSAVNDLSQLTFPEKLWYLVSEPRCEEINWGPEGLSIVILDSQEFSKKILNNPSKIYFKTKNLASFVRQLNLYGFRKVSDHKRVGDPQHDPNRCEFKHPCFRKDRKDLLEEVKRHQNSKKEESPSEEKPLTSPNNIPTYPSYFPINSMSVPFNMWTNWDAYLQSMGLFPYLPPASSPGAFVGMPSQAPGFYNRDAALGSPYVGYLPQYYPMPQPGYDDMCMFNTSSIDTMVNETKSIDSSSLTLPTVQVTPSKPSVVIINNTLSSSHDLPTENGCYGNCDVIKPIKEGGATGSDVYIYRGQEEAKKPIPAQRSEVSTTSQTGSAQKWRITDSVNPVRSLQSGNTQYPTLNMQSNNANIKVTTEEKPFDIKKEKDAAAEKEGEGSFQKRKKIRLEFK